LSRRQALKATGLGFAPLVGASAGCGPMPELCAAGQGAPEAAASSALSAVDHLVVVMLENRSFDNFLGGLRLDRDYPAAGVIDGLTGEEVNPDVAGTMIKTGRLPSAHDGTMDPLHDWIAQHACFNLGRNDSFVRVNAHHPGQAEVMTYLDRERLPFLHALASQSVVCDRWFSSVMGPTWPNRYYLHAGTAHGRTRNRPIGLGAPTTVWERLAERCCTGKNYYAGAVPWYSAAFPSKSFSGADAMVPEPVDGFFRDAARGELPNLAIIDPDFEVNDAHAPHSLALAEAFLSSIHRALMAGPAWSRTMLVITFDEHGGFYDHVPPPAVSDPHADFRQLGFRVPAIVTGPMVRQGQVVSTRFDHLAIAATLRARFGIASLGERMDASADLGACIDPERVAGATTLAQRPAPLPTVEVRSELTAAAAIRRNTQPEIVRLARGGGVPREHVDPRPPLERVQSWLRHAQALEAVRVRG
jgi:phospholipase C